MVCATFVAQPCDNETTGEECNDQRSAMCTWSPGKHARLSAPHCSSPIVQLPHSGAEVNGMLVTDSSAKIRFADTT